VDENSIDDDFPYLNGIASGTLNLALGAEPATEVDDTPGDSNSNLTLDLGFIRIDFGDLPSQYPTEMVNNAARHIIDNVTYLGALVDAESDGAPTVTALGDDTVDAIDDEDGVTFLTPIMSGQPYTIEVYLNAWVDFNGDGDLDDAGEQITFDEALVLGTNTLNLTAPTSTVPFTPTLYSRFRLSDNAGEVTTPDGEAPNGEIEDYALLSLGNLVWIDEGSGFGMAGNGKWDSDEPVLPGVQLELYLAGQTPGVSLPIATTITDSAGQYLFTGLVPGDYVVHIPASEFSGSGLLSGMVSSFGAGEPNADMDQEEDENGIDAADPAADGISSGIVILVYGMESVSEDSDPNSNLTIDFGFHGLVSLGNRVWFDPDNNGMHDAGEVGIADVELYLYNLAGKLVLNYDQIPMMTTTDENGYYLFDRLVPGYYIVVVHAKNFEGGGPLSGFENSDPTQKNPNFNHDTADHGLVPGDFDIAPSIELEGTLSPEDLISMDEILTLLEQGLFPFAQEIPTKFEIPTSIPTGLPLP